jgi:hypothetical protein
MPVSLKAVRSIADPEGTRMRHRIPLLIVLVALLAGGCAEATTKPGQDGAATSSHRPPKQKPPKKHHGKHGPRSNGQANPWKVPAIDMPVRRLTPGVALNVSAGQVCVPGYASSVRNVSSSLKDDVYARYNRAHVPYAHEVDHLISLSLGGSNDLRNLWPEPYKGRWGALTKDRLEYRLHAMVCAGEIRLKAAQRQESRNWVAAYRRYVSRALPPKPDTPSAPGDGSPGSSTSTGGYYASSYPTARTIYCANDSAWKSLSKTYLRHFTTFRTALQAFPGRHLHQPC